MTQVLAQSGWSKEELDDLKRCLETLRSEAEEAIDRVAPDTPEYSWLLDQTAAFECSLTEVEERLGSLEMEV